MEFPEVMFHLKIKKGDVGRYVLLPGDPGRCEMIANHFDNPKLIAYNREYKTYTGTLLGEKVSVTSHGIGAPSTAIALEELIQVGADTFIRVGTSGGMQPEERAGDLAIITAAIRDEGTTLHYMPIEFPAVADIEVVNALKEAASRLHQRYFLGITQSKDSFYGQHQPERMPVASRLQERWKAWTMGGAICSEMEAAVFFILGSIYRKRTGGVMQIIANQTADDSEVRKVIKENLDGLITTAIEAVKILIQKDKEK
jgi:uridine phosphorylase